MRLLPHQQGVKFRSRIPEYSNVLFLAETLRCPKCGQVFLPEEFVRGRMAEVAYELEDK